MTREDISEEDFLAEHKLWKDQNLIVDAILEFALKKKTKRTRQRFTPKILNTLAEEFKNDQLSSTKKRKALAKQLSIHPA